MFVIGFMAGINELAGMLGQMLTLSKNQKTYI
jgi:hypothetical protein